MGLRDGFVEAQGRMQEVIEQTIRQDIGGDVQMISTVDTRWADISFKHVLLPLWISAYRFKNRVFRFLINARTAEVQGERPYSWIKITLAALAALGVVGVIIALSQQ